MAVPCAAESPGRTPRRMADSETALMVARGPASSAMARGAPSRSGSTRTRAASEKFGTMRQAMRGVLPEKIRTRRDKTSFDGFFEYSLLVKEQSHVRDLMTNPLLAKMGIIKEDKLRLNYKNSNLNTNVNNQINYFWSFLTLEGWLREYYN